LDTEYLDTLWGAAKNYDPDNKSVRWAAIKRDPASNSKSASSLQGGTSPCQLTIAQAPQIGGIRLGTSLEDVARLLPSIRARHRSDFTPDGTGLTGLIAVPVATAEEEDRFPGVSQISFTFLNNRVTFFSANYRNYNKWKEVHNFASYISDKLSLPNEWQVKSKSKRSLNCAEFEIQVEVIGSLVTYVAFNDLLAEQAIVRHTGAMGGGDTGSGIVRQEPDGQPNNARSDDPPVPFRELKSFQRDGETEVWRNIVVSPNITKEQLIGLGKYLYQMHPRMRFNIFDEDKEFQAFVDWRLHFYKPDHDKYPWPQVWLKRHHLAMINRMSPAEPNTLGWVLFAQDGGSKFTGGAGSTLVVLE